MATLVITLTSTPLTATKTFTLSNADVTTLITWAQNYFPRANSAVAPTPQQALLSWLQDWINSTTGRIQEFNKTVNTPAPIVVS